MKNIVELYFENGKKVPFIVRREKWGVIYGLLITKVYPHKINTKWFGDVYGFALPPLDGSKANEYWGKPGKPIKLKSGGSYQWILVDEIPDEWKSYLNK